MLFSRLLCPVVLGVSDRTVIPRVGGECWQTFCVGYMAYCRNKFSTYVLLSMDLSQSSLVSKGLNAKQKMITK